MEKRQPNGEYNFHLHEDGIHEVKEQIMEVYNSGVVDQSNTEFDLDAYDGSEE